MMMSNKRLLYLEMDLNFDRHLNSTMNLFMLPTRELERLMADWEMQHIQKSGLPVCTDPNCTQQYIAVQAVYKFRLRVEPHHIVTHDLYAYQKVDEFMREGKKITIVESFSVRRVKEGDNIVLMVDNVGVDSIHRVNIISPPIRKDGTFHFKAEIELIKHDLQYLNN